MSAPIAAPLAPPKPRPGLAGLVALGLIALAGIGLVYYLVEVWNPELIARYGPLYLKGLGTTISLVLTSFVFGALLSLPIAFGRTARNPLARGLAFVFVYFFRGTPLIAQIFLVYYGFGQFRGFFEGIGLWWFFRDAWYCAILALSLNTAAYQAEILRGAIQSVRQGQWEGARALALPRRIIIRRVIAPQAMIVALRPYANEFILMVKASAIVAIISVFDLFGETRRAFSRSFDFQTYVWAAIFYLVLVEIVRRLTNRAEARLTRHLKR